MLRTVTCGLDECPVEFQTDNPQKAYCCMEHQNLAYMRRWRARRRAAKKGGGDDGGGNGGGGGQPLFDTLTPEDSRAIYVPDTCYRTPEEQPDRKPSVSDKPSIPSGPQNLTVTVQSLAVYAPAGGVFARPCFDQKAG